MNNADIAALMKGLAPVVRDYIAGAVQPLVDRIAELEKQAAAVEPARHGKDGDPGAIGERGEKGEPGSNGKDGAPGAQGRGVAKLLIDAKGHLIVTFTDGATDDVGLIVGKDGLDGADGRDGVDGKDGTPGRDGEKGVDGRDGVDGKDGLVGEPGKDGANGRDGADGQNGQDGKSVEIEAVAEMVRAEVEKVAPDLVRKAVDAIPRPADGKDGAPGERGEKGEPGQTGKDGQKGDPGEPGKGVSVDDVRPILAELVDTAVKALPAPKDGHSVTVEDVAPMIGERVLAAVSEAVKGIPIPKDGKDGRDGKDGDPGAKGADGLHGRNGLDAVTPILKDGVLMFTMSDGSVKEIGLVRGEDGAAGKDGAPGKDGLDGLGFDDMAVEYDGERCFALKFQRGDRVKDFPFTLPIVIDRGVWQERGIDGAGYKQSDGVSWGGSFYIARKDTFAKPDDFEAWRLSVKRGKDAKEPVNLK